MALYEIELSKKALQELDEAYEWYEEQLAGLGSRLLKEVNKYLTTISKSPKLFQIRFPDEIRAVPLKSPYLTGQEMKEEKQPKKKIKIGLLEGKIKLPSDFNEPLDDLKDYM